MAVYKVPQDVEAEDKLIGPFGFRQFIYLLIAAFFGFVAFLLARIFVGLVLIPAPIVLFFLIIALPLRKDQPTEVYLAAVLQYFLKAKKRMWIPDGIISTVTITAPKNKEPRRTKDISEDEAVDRLGHLAQLMDTRGWAARGVFNPNINSTGNVQLTDTAIAEVEAAEDMLDPNAKKSQSFDELIDQQKAISRQAVALRMGQAAAPAPVSQAVVQPVSAAPILQAEDEADRQAIAHAATSPYPAAIHQQVVQPVSAKPTQTTSDLPLSPDIIELAKRPELSIATIAEEAHRQADKRDKEVDIKLH